LVRRSRTKFESFEPPQPPENSRTTFRANARNVVRGGTEPI
jgi:hypothetical protein